MVQEAEWAFLRTSGKRTLAKLNAFDFIVTMALGSTLATVVLSTSVALAEGLVALAFAGGFAVRGRGCVGAQPPSRDAGQVGAHVGLPRRVPPLGYATRTDHRRRADPGRP